MPRPYKALRRQGYRRDLLLLQGVAHVLQMLRLFIPKHHLSVITGGGSITACHGAPLQPQCYLKIRSAHFMGEACLAHKKPCGDKAKH